jgi:hypothetical protein
MLRPIIRGCLVVSLSVGVLLGALPCLAQTPPTPPTPPNLLNQPAPSPQAGAPAGSGAVSGSALSTGPTATPVPGVGTIPSSSVGKSFGSAGQGLPGMPGGPPVSGTLGAQDPSSKYMRPPVIPPLLCDPATDIPC